jgi:hypothetical protein
MNCSDEPKRFAPPVASAMEPSGLLHGTSVPLLFRSIRWLRADERRNGSIHAYAIIDGGFAQSKRSPMKR